MAGRILVPGWSRALDSDGDPISAAISLFNEGTDALASVFSDEGLTTPLANPVQSNSAGRFPAIWASDENAYDWSVEAPYGPPGSPFTGTGLTTALAAEVLAADAADAAADAAALSAGEAATADASAQSALSQIEDIIANAPDAPSVAGKLDRDGDNAQPGLLANIGAVGSVALAAGTGGALVGVTQGGTGATTETLTTALRRMGVYPEQFGALGDAIIGADGYTPTNLGTNDQTAFDNAVAYLATLGGGTLYLSAKTYRVNQGVKIPQNVSIVGSSVGKSALFKPGTSTRTITPYGVAAGGLSTDVYPVATLPTSINAVLILDGPSGRWIGQVRDVTLIGGLSGTDLDTDMQTELGLVSTGSVSDSAITNVTVFVCKQGFLIPDIFTSRITENRINRCLRGLGVNKSTSLTLHGNYASSCRDYSIAIRDSIYGTAFANAADATNDPALFSDRTTVCYAYKILGCDAFDFRNNGQEQTWGTNFLVTANGDTTIEDNTVFGLGSDYAGASLVSVWELGNGNVRVTIQNNPVITYKSSGLLSGSADPAKHFNILSNSRPDQRLVTWKNNTIRESRGSRSTLSRGYAGAWAGPSPAAGTFGGTSNPPLENVQYDILFDGVANTLLLGGEQGVAFTDNGTGNYTFTFDQAFSASGKFAVVATTLVRVLATPGDTYGMGAHELGRTASSVTIGCQFTNGVYYDHERLGLRVSGYVDRMA